MESEQQAPAGPTRIVATTWFVAGSIRETLGSPLFATQTTPAETAIPSGCGPTPIVATRFVARVDSRNRVVHGVGNPDGAVAGGRLAAARRHCGARIPELELDASGDRVSCRIDARKGRAGIAHCPHGSFSDRKAAGSGRNPDSRDDLAAARQSRVTCWGVWRCRD
jgi:hypothetical protein